MVFCKKYIVISQNCYLSEMRRRQKGAKNLRSPATRYMTQINKYLPGDF